MATGAGGGAQVQEGHTGAGGGGHRCRGREAQVQGTRQL